jgi:hypothetical protein
MIERTAEFNAQILAFLTGDARYLDYAEVASRTDEEEAEYAEDVDSDLTEEDDVASEPADVAGSSEGAPDPAPQPDDAGGHEDLPNVVRKQGDRYPARNRSAEPEPSDPPFGDGAEDDQRPRSRAGRTPSEENFIPELPEDLFDWPEARGEFHPRERPRTGSSEEHGDGSDESEIPPRP